MRSGQTLLIRHGAAWMTDRWYRRACFIAPQALALLLIVLVVVPDITLPPLAVAARWSHAYKPNARALELQALFDQAKADASLEAKMLQFSNAGEIQAMQFMARLLDPRENGNRATPERTQQAIALYRKAIALNSRPAMANLGLLLISNRFGIPLNYAEAIPLLEQSAGDNRGVQRELGLLYRDGRGVNIDREKAMVLLQSAADRGDTEAKRILTEGF